MKKIALIVSVVLLSVAVNAQFPSTDSLHRYNNRWIRNQAVTAFSELRLNTLIHGIIQWIDSARAGEGGVLGVDSITVLNDSTIRYRKNGVYYNFNLPGIYDGTNGVTKYGGVIGFGGTLVQTTNLDQNGNPLTFNGGSFTHTYGNGTLVHNSTSFYSSYINGNNTSQILNTLAGGTSLPEVRLTATSDDYTSGSELVVHAGGIEMTTQTSSFIVRNIKDSVQGKQLYYDPPSGLISYGDVNSSGGGDPLEIDNSTLTGANTGIDPVRVDTTVMPTMWKLYDALDSLGAAVSGGLSLVTHDGYGLLGDGTPGTPLKIDSNAYTTLTKLYQIADSLGFIVDSSSFPGIFAGSGISISGSYETGFTINNTGAPGTNPQNALDIRNYGGKADAVIPASGLAPSSGTDNTGPFNLMMAAAADGQLCIIPNGNWWFKSAPDTLYNKRVNLLILGNTYHVSAAGVRQNFIVIKNNSGAFKQHRIVHAGIMSAVANLPTHRKTPSRISPNWSSYTGTGVTVYNTDQVYFIGNKIQGFKNGLEVKGGGGNGAQENRFYAGWLCENANDIALTSVDGNSFVDKNKFFFDRAGGGLVIDIDGYAPSVGDGPYNGAFRSNEFHGLIEFADSAILANGDITEPLFNITVEGGVNTGILGSTPFQCKITSPNYVRSPKWTGQGVYGVERLGSGSSGSMGINGTIDAAIWGPNSCCYYGNHASIDGTGRIIIETPVTTSASTRSAAPAYVKFVNQPRPLATADVNANYTVQADDYFIMYNGTIGSFTVTLPSASTSVGRELSIEKYGSGTVVNFSGSTSNVAPIATGGAGGVVLYCDGNFWRTKSKWHD